MSLRQLIGGLTLVVEAIDAIDGCTFMIASQQEEVLRILDLVRQE
jgi:hypothetical protein